MKRLSVSGLILLFSCIMCLAQSGKAVTVVDFDHPPFAYQDANSQEAKGAEIAYLTAILKDLGYQPTFTFVPFARLINMLQSGESDIGPLLMKTAEREEFVYFSSKSVLTMNPVLVVLKDSPLKQLKTLSNLKGMNIWFTANLTVPAFFKNSNFPFNMTTGRYVTEQNFNMLKAKRFDAFLEMNPYNLKVAAKTLGLADSIRIIEVPKSASVYYCTIAKKSKIAAELLKGINAGMNTRKYDFEKFFQEELK